MSIFSKIKNAIFGSSEAKAATPATTSADAAPGAGAKGLEAAAGATMASTGGKAEVDVAGVLTKLAAENKEKLDWRRSIVDLMKLLKLDSSLAARKELAKELNYTGDMDDSASMNIWLHKQVMQKLAAHGGKVPEELKS